MSDLSRLQGWTVVVSVAMPPDKLTLPRRALTEYERSIKTKYENKAEGILRRVEDTILFLEQGRIVMPPDANPGPFILSDGKLNERVHAKPNPIRTLADLFTT